MPISNGTFTVPNNFVQQYDQGQKKIRADLMDENFNDVAGAINTLLTDDANTVHLTGAETISGNKTFTETIIGNASTATALQTARTINGVSFDGTANITVADSTKVALDGSNLSGATVKTVVETWHSGTEWYRVWSDGWIEQGGILAPALVATVYTANLYKSYLSTDYTLLLHPLGATSAEFSAWCSAYKAATNSFSYRFNSSNSTISSATSYRINWIACGF